MKVYYWKGKKNFGDLLAPLLINKFCHLSSEWSEPEEAELIMVGSIIDKFPTDYKGVIAGCGVMHERTNILMPNAKILAVRGPLTAKALNLDYDVVQADPGLIADELVGFKDKEYELGIVPHWTDKDLEKDPRFTKFRHKIIRVSDDPLQVIAEIATCKKIVSSSLHGIILADAYGIPRRIEIPPRALSHSHQEGGLFKWQDYSASIGMRLEVGMMQTANRQTILKKQNDLFTIFQNIKSLFS
jgi:pyruvyltransferase